MEELPQVATATVEREDTGGPAGLAREAKEPRPGAAPGPPRRARRWGAAASRVALIALLALGLAMLVLGMTPQTKWQDLGFAATGPLPRPLLSLTPILFYAIPALIGALCRRWQVALVLATAPAWLDLGVFAVVVAGQLGPYYLVQSHPDGAVGTLELYAALGLAGWLVRVGALRAAGRWRR